MTDNLPAAAGDLLRADVESLSSIEAVQRVKAVDALVTTVHALAETQIMAAMWAIRRDHPEREDFLAFAGRHFADMPRFSPERCWLLARTWEAARGNADLRRLARERPDQAAALVEGFVDAGCEEGLDDLDESHRAVVREVYAAAPRKRMARIAQLLETEKAAADGRNPADVLRIETLEAERDRALEMAGEAGEARPGATAAELQDIERRLEPMAAGLVDAFNRGAVSESMRQRVLYAADMIQASLDRIAGAAHGVDGAPEWMRGDG